MMVSRCTDKAFVLQMALSDQQQVLLRIPLQQPPLEVLYCQSSHCTVDESI